MTNEGGTKNLGVVFEFDPITKTVTKKLDFNGTNGSHPGSASFALVQQNQTISFPQIADKSIDCPSFNAGATASSGLPLNYSSSNPAVATVSQNGMVTIIAQGSTTITAYQNGNSYYSPAVSVSQVMNVTATVIQGPSIEAWPSGTSQMCAQTLALGASIVTPGVYTWGVPAGDIIESQSSSPLQTVVVRWKSIGQKQITLNYTDSQGCPRSQSVYNWTVNTKVPQTINLPQYGASTVTKTYGDQPFNLPFSSTSGYPLVWQYYDGQTDVVTISNANIATILNAGTTQYTIRAPETNCYLEASIIGGIIVNKALHSITCSPPPTEACDNIIFSVTSSGNQPIAVDLANGFITDGPNFNTFNITSSGNFSFKSVNNRNYADAYGCQIQTIVYVTPNVSIFTNDPLTRCNDGIGVNLSLESLEGDGSPITYQWMKNGNSISATNHYEYLALTTGEYRLKVRQHVCESLSNQINVTINNCYDFDIFPNPANSYFTITPSTTPTEYIGFRIMDSFGNAIYQFSYPPGLPSMTVDASWMGNGVYTIAGTFVSNIITKSFSVSH